MSCDGVNFVSAQLERHLDTALRPTSRPDNGPSTTEVMDTQTVGGSPYDFFFSGKKMTEKTSFMSYHAVHQPTTPQKE